VTTLSPTEIERYRRQMMLPSFGQDAQEKLKSSTALVTGVGGLGGTAALYLAVAGVGRLILVRGGDLQRDDLNRQVLMTDDWVGKPRVFKAQQTLQALNPDIQIEAVCEYVNADNIDALVQQCRHRPGLCLRLQRAGSAECCLCALGQTHGRSRHEQHGSLPHHHCAGANPLPHLSVPRKTRMGSLGLWGVWGPSPVPWPV
jgi:hypothetical protein